MTTGPKPSTPAQWLLAGYVVDFVSCRMRYLPGDGDAVQTFHDGFWERHGIFSMRSLPRSEWVVERNGVILGSGPRTTKVRHAEPETCRRIPDDELPAAWRTDPKPG